MIILFAWLVVGTGASVLVAIIGQPDYFVLDYLVLGPFGKFLFVMAGFPFFLAGVLIAVSLIHRRYPRTLVTARERIDWRRIGQGFVAWSVPACLIGVLGQYLFYPDSFSFNFDLATFALFVPLALVFTAIQTTTEELFFRGYIVQGASMISTSRVFLALVAAVAFTLPHLLNPEVSAGEGVQTRRGIRTRFPGTPEGSLMISSVRKTISKCTKGLHHYVSSFF